MLQKIGVTIALVLALSLSSCAWFKTRDQVSKAARIEQRDAYKQMQEAMKAEMDSQGVASEEREGTLTLIMMDSTLFNSGESTVREEGIRTLSKVAEALKTLKDTTVLVAGHTDNVKMSESLSKIYPTNWELSVARAVSVVKVLEADGVDPKILCAAGFSEYRPVASNDTPEGRAKNRRIEIILTPKYR